MKKRTFNLIAAVIAAVFVMTVIYFMAGVISDRKRGPALAEEIFDSLVEKTKIAAENFEPGTYSFSDAFIRAAGNFANYQKLSLSFDGNLLYSYPSKDAWYSKKSPAQAFSRTFQDKKGRSFSINAEICTTLQDSLFYRARTAFLVIFFATLTAVLILFFAKADAAEKDDEEDDSEEISFEDEIDRIVFEDETPVDDVPLNDTPVDEMPVDEMTAEEMPANEMTADDTNDPQPNEGIKDEDFNGGSVAVVPEIEIQEEPSSYAQQDDQSLEGRCEEALVKAAEDGSDVSILVIKASGSENEIIFPGQMKEDFAGLFDPADVFFSEDDGSMTVVLEKTNLDEAMIPAKKAYELLQEKLTGAKTTVGISARNDRTISSERLLTEAKEAQKHAETEPDSPIIAFRASPEKYKDLILNS